MTEPRLMLPKHINHHKHKQIKPGKSKLVMIPTVLSYFTHSIDISLQSITILPTNLASIYPNLKKLKCNTSQLSSLPLLPPKIEIIHCENNNIESLSGECLPNTITELYLSHNSITNLPLFLPNSLKILDCSHNKLTELPICITYLPLLEKLVCSDNALTTLPILPNSLHWLQICSNQITELNSLPTNLTHLLINNNQLLKLPDTLPATLIQLSCSNNKINTLPSLPSTLIGLYCNGNNLVTLPTFPDDLLVIHCQQNHITSLPTLPDGLLQLICFTNELTELPEFPETLKTISCGDNDILRLPSLPNKLEYLSCSNNPRISVLPDFGNYLTELSIFNTNIQWLDSYSVRFKKIIYNGCVDNIPHTTYRDVYSAIEVLDDGKLRDTTTYYEMGDGPQYEIRHQKRRVSISSDNSEDL